MILIIVNEEKRKYLMGFRFRFIVFNATFNNISVISRWSVLYLILHYSAYITITKLFSQNSSIDTYYIYY